MATEDLNTANGQLEGKGITLSFLIRSAYDIQGYQLAGIPSSLASNKYDITGKMDTLPEEHNR